MKLDYNIKELIKKYAALIETNEFDQLYLDMEDNYQVSGYIPDLTRVLESVKIYPLFHMTYIPTWMYYKSEASVINIPNTIESINQKAFKSAHAETITMTDKVKYLGDNCFYDCEQLTNIKLSNNLEVIPKYCFRDCIKLESIELPSKCSVIEFGAFVDCEKLKVLDFNNQLSTIGSCAFLGTGLQEVHIPNSVKQIDNGAFSHCAKLEKVVIPSNTKIKSECFDDCDQLREVVLGKGVELVDGFNFSDCGNLEIITYLGTKEQFRSKNLPRTWSGGSSIEVVRCTDGDIEL